MKNKTLRHILVLRTDVKGRTMDLICDPCFLPQKLVRASKVVGTEISGHGGKVSLGGGKRLLTEKTITAV